MLTQRRMEFIEKELYDMRHDLRQHLEKLEEEGSIYNISSVKQLEKVLDSVTEAIEAIEEMKQ